MARLSDRLYRLLLRLYPSAFLEEYGAELERHFRDDLRMERRPVRLWMDIVADLAFTLPRQHTAELANNLRYGFRLLRRAPASVSP